MEIVVNGEIIQYTTKRQTDRNNVTREYLRASIIVSCDPGTGAIVKKEITASSVDKLKEKIRSIQHVRSLDNGSVLPFQQYMEEWMKHNKIRLKPSTYHNYEFALSHYILPYLGTVKMVNLSEDVLFDFFSNIINTFGVPTAQRVKILLGRPLREACEKHLTYGNIISCIKLPKQQSDQIIPLCQEEAKQLICLCREDLHGGPVALSLLLGLRISECIGLSLDCFDLERRQIRIRRQIIQVGSDFILQNSTKNNLERILYLDDPAIEFIERELKRQKENKENAGEMWNNEYNCLFTDKTGNFIKHQTLRKHFHTMAEKIGRPDLKYHHLRHSAATIVHEQTNDVHIAKDILGHKRYDSTGIYIHASPEKKKQAAISISKYVSS